MEVEMEEVSDGGRDGGGQRWRRGVIEEVSDGGRDGGGSER